MDSEILERGKSDWLNRSNPRRNASQAERKQRREGEVNGELAEEADSP